MTVQEITFESNIRSDGTMTVTFNFLISLDEKTAETNVVARVYVGYKLTDSSGIVRDSGTIMTGDVALGETIAEDMNIYDLDPNETYTLTLIDAT